MFIFGSFMISFFPLDNHCEDLLCRQIGLVSNTFLLYTRAKHHFYFPGFLLMKFILDGRTRKPFPFKVSQCTKWRWVGLLLIHIENLIFLPFFFSPVYIYFLGTNFTNQSPLLLFRFDIFVPFCCSVVTTVTAAGSLSTFTQECSTGLSNCVELTLHTIVVLAAVNKTFIAVFLHPNTG